MEILKEFADEATHFHTRPLSIVDYDEVMRVSTTRAQLMGYDYDYWYSPLYMRAAAEAYLSESTDRILYGAFDGSRLVAYVGARYWSTHPYWTMSLLRTDAEYSRNGVFKNGLRDCIELAVESAIKANTIRCYYIANADWVRKGALTKHTPFQRYANAFQKFDIYTEAIVPSGERPSYPYLWEIINKRTYPFDIVIRTCVLKEEHRIRMDF